MNKENIYKLLVKLRDWTQSLVCTNMVIQKSSNIYKQCGQNMAP